MRGVSRSTLANRFGRCLCLRRYDSSLVSNVMENEQENGRVLLRFLVWLVGDLGDLGGTSTFKNVSFLSEKRTVHDLYSQFRHTQADLFATMVLAILSRKIKSIV